MADIAELGLYIDSSGVIRATKELRKLHGQSGKNERANKKLSRSFGGLKMAVAAVGVVALTKQLISQINTYTAMTNKLRLVTTSSKNLADVQDRLFNIAQESRVSLEAATDLYFRLAKSTDALGISQARVADVTETINKAVAISGTTTQAAAAALFQLGQGLAANALRGQELNSVLEQTPRVAQAIADGLGVPIGRLRDMAAEGKLTAKVVMEAFESQADVINKEMEQTSTTVQQAWLKIENQALKTFGSLDATDLVSGLDELRNIISDPSIISGLQSIASVMLTITGLAIKAAAGWGMIFDAIGQFVEPDSPAVKLLELIESTKASMKGMGEGPVKAATERLLEQYKAQLNAIYEADRAKKEMDQKDPGGLGDGEADRIAAQEASKLEALKESHAEALEERREFLRMRREIDIEDAEREIELNEEKAAAKEASDNIILASEQRTTDIMLTLGNTLARGSKTAQKAMLAITAAVGAASTIASSYIEAGRIKAAYAALGPAGIATGEALAAKAIGMGKVRAGLIVGSAAVNIGQAHDGMDNVPRTGSYLLEKGEAVMKKQEAGKMRAGDGGGNNINVTVMANDAESFSDQLSRGKDDLWNIIMDRMNEETLNFS